MIVLLVASLVVLVGLVVALVLMRGERLSVHAAPATSTMSGGLPPGELDSADIDEVRFDTVLRGYRMDQVDDVLERVRAELARRDDELRRLRSQAPSGPVRGMEDRAAGRAGLAGIVPPTVWEDDLDDDLDDFGDFRDVGAFGAWGSRAEQGDDGSDGGDDPRGTPRDRPDSDR